jgi:hypothetical protein
VPGCGLVIFIYARIWANGGVDWLIYAFGGMAIDWLAGSFVEENT